MKNTLLTIAAIAALISPLTADDKEPPLAGATLSKETLHRLDGKAFKEAELKGSPDYFILYFSASY